MKYLFVLCLLVSGLAQAQDTTFLAEGFGEAYAPLHTDAINSAVAQAKAEAQMDANNACWSRRSVGILCGDYQMTDFHLGQLEDKVFAKVSVAGEFQCGKRGSSCK